MPEEQRFNTDLEELRPATRRRCQHIISTKYSNHWSSTLEAYRNPPAVKSGSGITRTVEYLSGKVELDFALGVRLVLDGVVYDPNIDAQGARVIISLQKMLDMGCTREVDSFGHWIIRHDGRLLMYAIKCDRFPDDRRLVLGPPLADDEGARIAQSVANGAEPRLVFAQEPSSPLLAQGVWFADPQDVLARHARSSLESNMGRVSRAEKRG